MLFLSGMYLRLAVRVLKKYEANIWFWKLGETCRSQPGYEPARALAMQMKSSSRRNTLHAWRCLKFCTIIAEGDLWPGFDS